MVVEFNNQILFHLSNVNVFVLKIDHALNVVQLIEVNIPYIDIFIVSFMCTLYLIHESTVYKN